MEQVYKHIGKLVVAGLVTLVFSGFAYVGSTYEQRLHDRITVLESRFNQLDRVEQKLDDLIGEVRRIEQSVGHKE